MTARAEGPAGGSILDRVVAVLARYDDEAWVALASRGLLRRAHKDLASLDVALVDTAELHGADDVDGAGCADGAVNVTVAVGDKKVRFGPAGPAEATCSCPSPVLCQHVIAAGLWLAGGRDGTDAGPAEATPVELHDQLMALDAAALTSYAGLPGYRWAHHFLDDLDQPPAVVAGGYLTVTFARPELTVRYLGGGPEGLVLDQDVPHAERYRVAAVLAWQRAHGLALPPPPARPSGAAGRPPTETATTRAESRARLRRTATALLRDMVAVGVSHLSPAIHERAETAATWAQGVDYHRLARLLRRIADQVDLMLARSAAADDLRLLDDLAVAHALVAALEAAASGEAEPVALVGRARTTYDPVRSLDLVGLGGSAWRTGSGYHGLTCVFWSPSRQRMYTWTDTRPEDVPGFDPRQRWTQPAPWTGLATPATAAGRRVLLTRAQVSPDGRISGVASTSAAVTPLDSDELVTQLAVHTTWAEVAPAGPRALSDPADATSAWTVLRPVHALPAVWDPAAQSLTWTLLDAEGLPASMQVPWSRLNAHAIERLEDLGGALPAGALVVARVRRARGVLSGEPVSVVLPDRPINPVDAVHFDPGPRGGTSSLVARLLAAGTPDRPPADAEQPDHPAALVVPAPLAQLRVLVEQEAQRGCSGAVPGSVVARIASAHRSLRDLGLSVFADPDPQDPPAAALLRSLYLVQQVESALS